MVFINQQTSLGGPTLYDWRLEKPRCSGDQPPGRPGAAGEGRVSSDPRQELAR